MKVAGLLIFILIGFSSGKTLNYMSMIQNNDVENPPDYKKYAEMARYLVHNSNWTSMGTISSLPQLNGFPMVNVISVADSAKDEKSTGKIFFYLTMLDFTGQDLSKKNKLTALFSMDQTLYCSKNDVDPMEPTCARTMISGSIEKVNKDSEEYEFGTRAMKSRHPASQHWLNVHDFFLCKLKISQVVVLDYYGGPHYVTVEDYYKAKLDQENSPSHSKIVSIKLNRDSQIKVINIEI